MAGRLSAYWRLHRIPILLLVLGLVFYFVFAYHLLREDTVKLLALYGALQFLCFKLIQFEKWNLRFLLVAGILFRLVFIYALPNLSQDFYRFIWDGRLVLAGINPYMYTPDELLQQGVPPISQATELLEGMGALSARHFSNYPPLNQVFFALGALVGGKSIMGSVIAMRMLILAADLGVVYFGRKLLRMVNRSPHLIFWYFLNPLIIVELTGNLHFEGVMLLFFTISLYVAGSPRRLLSGALYGCSILLKLVPLMFLPIFISYYGLKKSLLFYLGVAASVLLFTLPFMAPEVLGHYSATLGLWFKNFEFNAGFYNIVKHLGVSLEAKPWKLIKDYGKLIPYIMFALVALYSLIVKKEHLQGLLKAMFWVVLLYFLLSPTVHPWYLIFPLALCLFTDFRFPLFWAAVVAVSYAAYANPDHEENMALLLVEYFVVYAVMLYEFIRYKRDFVANHKN
jgi:alpha-1,6-mannosyltransferase